MCAPTSRPHLWVFKNQDLFCNQDLCGCNKRSIVLSQRCKSQSDKVIQKLMVFGDFALVGTVFSKLLLNGLSLTYRVCRVWVGGRLDPGFLFFCCLVGGLCCCGVCFSLVLFRVLVFNLYSFCDTFVYKEGIKAEQKSLFPFMELCLVNR